MHHWFLSPENPEMTKNLALYGIGLFCILFISLVQWLPELWSNLGTVKRNHGLLAEVHLLHGTKSEDLTQALALMARSNKFDACNPFGFDVHSLVDCTEVTQWMGTTITSTTGVTQSVFISAALSGLEYRQFHTLLLPEHAYTDLDAITLFTCMANSTRITQDSLVGYVMAIDENQEVFFAPLRAGVETAEGMYDFPDIPPKHEKPPISYRHDNGGLAYPATLHFGQTISLKSISVLFAYSQQWHIAPYLCIWAISPQKTNL
jgi:hypothetical protein